MTVNTNHWKDWHHKRRSETVLIPIQYSGFRRDFDPLSSKNQMPGFINLIWHVIYSTANNLYKISMIICDIKNIYTTLTHSCILPFPSYKWYAWTHIKISFLMKEIKVSVLHISSLSQSFLLWLIPSPLLSISLEVYFITAGKQFHLLAPPHSPICLCRGSGCVGGWRGNQL